MSAQHPEAHPSTWSTAAPPAGVLLSAALLVLGHLPAVNAKGIGGPLSICVVAAFCAACAARHLPASPKGRERRELTQRFLDGVFTTLLTTLLLGVLFQVTPLGAQAERLAFEAFHSGRSAGAQRPVVVVVDISSLEGEPVTDRKALQAFLERVVFQAGPRERPTAIGIDVNFHQPGGGFLNPREEQETEFLETCYRANTVLSGGTRDPHRPRLLLGVTDAIPDPPDTWVVMDRYRSLGGSIDVPFDVSARSYARFRIGDGAELPGMGMALATAHRGGIRPHPPLPGTELFGEQRLVEGIHGELHCLDYASLQQISEEVLPIHDVLNKPEARKRLAGRVVLLGDVERAEIGDAFAIPGRVRALPGVFIHALSAETLIKGPLYEFTPPVNVGLDVAFGMVGIACLTLLPSRRPEGSALQDTVTLTTLLFVQAVVCLWLFSLGRVIWLEAFGVALGLVVGPYLEAILERGAHVVGRTGAAAPTPVEET